MTASTTHLQTAPPLDRTSVPSRTRPRRSARSQGAIIPLLLCLLLCQLGLCAKSLSRALNGNVDFRVFYASGHLLATGHGSSLYDPELQRSIQDTFVAPDTRTLPFLYPAFAAVLFAPFTLLQYKLAFFAFALFNLTLLFMSTAWLQRRAKRSGDLPDWFARVVPFSLVSLCLFPVSIALMQGQVTFLLLFLYTACFLAIERGRTFLAGALLAAALIKFQIALPIAFLFLIWRQGRFLLGFALGAAALAALSLALTGPDGVAQYLTSLIHITGQTLAHPEFARQHYGMSSAEMPNLHGLFSLLAAALSHSPQGSPLAVFLLIAISSALVLLWAARQRPSLALALPAAMLVSYHLQPYDLTLLILPLSLAFAPCRNASTSDGQRTTTDGQLTTPKSPRKPTGAASLATIALLLTIPVAPFLLLHGLGALLALAPFTALALQSVKDPVKPQGFPERANPQ